MTESDLTSSKVFVNYGCTEQNTFYLISNKKYMIHWFMTYDSYYHVVQLTLIYQCIISWENRIVKMQSFPNNVTLLFISFRYLFNKNRRSNDMKEKDSPVLASQQKTYQLSKIRGWEGFTEITSTCRIKCSFMFFRISVSSLFYIYTYLCIIVYATIQLKYMT